MDSHERLETGRSVVKEVTPNFLEHALCFMFYVLFIMYCVLYIIAIFPSTPPPSIISDLNII